jgi:hypothetical protein
MIDDFHDLSQAAERAKTAPPKGNGLVAWVWCAVVCAVFFSAVIVSAVLLLLPSSAALKFP